MTQRGSGGLPEITKLGNWQSWGSEAMVAGFRVSFLITRHAATRKIMWGK